MNDSLSVSGPYRATGDVWPSFRIDTPHHIVASVYVVGDEDVEIARVRAETIAKALAAPANAAEIRAKEVEREPMELWLKVHRLRTATMHGDPTDRARIVAAVMGDFTADDILTLQRLSEATANGK